MIGDILNLVAKEVSEYIDKQLKLPSGKKSVVLHKPNNVKGDFDIPENSISLTLLNIEEELGIRYTEIEKYVINKKVYKRNPPVNLHLQIIFIANFQNDYMSELNYITKVIEFFQRKPTFNLSNTKELKEFNIEKLALKLNTLPLERQSSVWSMLGGRYLPSVVYQVGMITIQEKSQVSDEAIVKVVDIDTKQKKI